ncbi:MAG: glycogen synthase [Candidatus Omnitrophica bacterium]|nr:glycogen synthase [Candidatus Omnitrophota bacterium]
MPKRKLKTLLLTNEYPPYVYGGAGIHVDYLSRALSKLCQVDVRCFGDQKKSGDSLSVTGYELDHRTSTAPDSLKIVFGAIQRCLDFNSDNIDADIVHVHTWYTHLGGILAKLNYSIPLVLTVHSLEPLRPWKREQLGGGYDFSCWIEKKAIELADAVVAVSEETKNDILRLFHVDAKKIHVVYNGIDPDEFRPVNAPGKMTPFGIDPAKPFILFVGRITRQKGIIHLVNAIKYLDPDFQVVLCAGAPDTKEIGAEMQAHVAQMQKEREGIIWIREMVDLPTKVALYSHADLFCCPSIYEPFGIINLEAMACETPVVASAVGGIQEAVVDGKTGVLVPVRQKMTSPFEPINPDKFSRDLATQINRLMADKSLRIKMGKAGRRRAVDVFSWHTIAKEIYTLYRTLLLHQDKSRPQPSDFDFFKDSPVKQLSQMVKTHR